MEEQPTISFRIEMDGNRLDTSVNSDELVLTANVDFWAFLYLQLKDVFEDLEDAEEDGRST